MPHELNFQLMLVSIFAVANNFKSLGNFLQLSEKLPRSNQLRLSMIATIASLCIMLVALLLGEELLKFLNVSLDSFRVAGGLILLILGLDMVHARNKPEDELTSNHRALNYSSVISSAIIPIAIPLTTGAGTFSTIVILESTIGDNSALYWQLIAALLVQSAINYLVFRYSNYLLRLLGHVGMSVLTRIVGLFTLTLGVQFMATGLRALFPGIAG